MAIPRLLHQTCASRTALPAVVQQNIEQLGQRNPDWRHTVYENASQFDYMRRHFEPEVYDAARTIHPDYGVVVADLFRYLVVYREGGVYLDIKSSVQQPLSRAIQPTDRFLLSQWKNGPGQAWENWGIHPEIDHHPGGEFQQWFIAAEPGHPFLKTVIRDTLRNIRRYDPERSGTGKHAVLQLSGPICYTLAILSVLQSSQPPCQRVDIESRGFVYSIWPNHHLAEKHYSHLTAPLVSRSLVN